MPFWTVNAEAMTSSLRAVHAQAGVKHQACPLVETVEVATVLALQTLHPQQRERRKEALEMSWKQSWRRSSKALRKVPLSYTVTAIYFA